jgi:hypothetical protein
LALVATADPPPVEVSTEEELEVVRSTEEVREVDALRTVGLPWNQRPMSSIQEARLSYSLSPRALTEPVEKSSRLAVTLVPPPLTLAPSRLALTLVPPPLTLAPSRLALTLVPPPLTLAPSRLALTPPALTPSRLALTPPALTEPSRAITSLTWAKATEANALTPINTRNLFMIGLLCQVRAPSTAGKRGTRALIVQDTPFRARVTQP